MCLMKKNHCASWKINLRISLPMKCLNLKHVMTTQKNYLLFSKIQAKINLETRRKNNLLFKPNNV